MLMSELDEYQRRITAAMDRVAKGLDRLSSAAPAPDADIEQALEDERLANAQLEERVKSLRESHAAEMDALRDQMEATSARMEQIDLDLQRLRQANAQLSEACEKLREANAEGLADPKLIDTALVAELESLRATRNIEMAEIDAVLSALAPLVDEAEDEAPAPVEEGEEDTGAQETEAQSELEEAPKTGETN